MAISRDGSDKWFEIKLKKHVFFRHAKLDIFLSEIGFVKDKKSMIKIYRNSIVNINYYENIIKV